MEILQSGSTPSSFQSGEHIKANRDSFLFFNGAAEYGMAAIGIVESQMKWRNENVHLDDEETNTVGDDR